MSITTFARRNFDDLWIVLRADEELGPINGGFIEDYYGDVGYITLYHVDTEVEYQMAMLPVPEETPEIDNDVFEGTLPLAPMDNGLYEVRFRVTDLVGNRTISNSVQNPFGGERIISLMLNIVEQAYGYVYDIGALIARGGYAVNLARPVVTVPVPRFPASVVVPRSHVYVELD